MKRIKNFIILGIIVFDVLFPIAACDAKGLLGTLNMIACYLGLALASSFILPKLVGSPR